MIKYLFSSVLLLSSLFSISQSSKKFSGKGLIAAITYSNPDRKEFDLYTSVIGSTLNLQESIRPKNNIGIMAGVSFRNGRGEFEMGGGLQFGIRVTGSNADESVSAALSTNSFDLHMGFSSYLAGPFYLGCDIGVIANQGKMTFKGSAASFFENSPSSSNPFKGYAFAIKPKAGFFFPVTAGSYTGFKLQAFYDYSISKYEFYKNDIFDNRLKNYTGATKSATRGLGFLAGFIFSLD